MQNDLNAEVIAIGTEILLGEITDTNSVYMAQQLRDLGINLYYMTSVGDNQQRIADAIQIALDRADIVLTCGGLGPTVDDMTRAGIALAMERELVFHETLFDQIVARFEMYKVKMTENNRRQAYLPEGAIPIENPVGTAPAFMVQQNNKVVVSLPGVPREMKFLMTERVIPYLLEKYQLGIIKARILKTAGIGESSLDDLLGNDLLEGGNPTIGLAAHHGTIDIRITAKSSSADEADVMLEDCAQKVRQIAGQYIFGEGDDELEPMLIQLLQQSGRQLHITEAGIDNAVIGKLNAFRDGAAVIAEMQRFSHPQELAAALRLESDTPLRVLAETVVQAVQDQPNQIGIAVLSLPDVNESADVDVATVVAVYTSGKLRSRVYGFGGSSDLARDWVSRWAMAIAWRMIKEAQDELA